MLRKTLLALCSSVAVGTAAMAPNAALAFFPPPPMGGLGGLPHLGPPPMAHLGGLPHPGGLPPRAGGPAPRAGLGGAAGRFNGLPRSGGRAAASGYGRSGGNGYARSGGYSYGRSGHGYGRYRHGRYGVDVAGSGSSYSDDSCYYSYTSSGRRIRVCDED
jgi:hypothetical protein